MFALIDCNNFYVSCEQVFNPRLKKKPVVVLSNNDGCIIARSPEVKALGVEMGAAVFKYRELFAKEKVEVLSSNYTLYGDMSARVMSILDELGYPLHIYSIDEAFLQLPSLSAQELENLAHFIKERIYQWTGLPVSIGIAPTQTLAKAANKIAKKTSSICVFANIEDVDRPLSTFPVQDLWGIGRKLGAFLNDEGIRTALQLKSCSDAWIKKHLSVSGLRLVWELRGISCIEWEDIPSLPKTIVSSRSFGKEVTSIEVLKQAVATFTSRAAEKLRTNNALAGFLSVFVTTNPFGKNPLYSNTASLNLASPTSYTPDLIHSAHLILDSLFKEGYSYKKAGIMLGDIVSNAGQQLDIFNPINPKKDTVMRIVDEINHSFGKGALTLGAEGVDKPWKGAASRCSQQFTTRWDEILHVEA